MTLALYSALFALVNDRFCEAPALPRFLRSAMPFHRRAFVTPGGMKMHFVDEGVGRPVLLVHGNPTWSFLWRKVILKLRRSGVRIIAPDLLGFGLSDKPRRVGAHSLGMHIEAVHALVEALELQRMTVVGQDWGGPIAAGVAERDRGRVEAAVFGNTAILRPARPFRPKAFHRFSHLPLLSDLVFRGLAFPVPVLRAVQGERSSIGPRELAAYYYPFRRLRDRAGPLGLARMVPNAEAHPSTALMDRIGVWAGMFEGRMALVWGLRDPLLGRSFKRHQQAFPRALAIETRAGHFLQEEVPDELVSAILEVSFR